MPSSSKTMVWPIRASSSPAVKSWPQRTKVFIAIYSRQLGRHGSGPPFDDPHRYYVCSTEHRPEYGGNSPMLRSLPSDQRLSPARGRVNDDALLCLIRAASVAGAPRPRAALGKDPLRDRRPANPDGASNLFDRVEIPILGGRVLADAQRRLLRKVIGGDRQIVGRGDGFEHAARQVVFRAMARAKIPTEPIGRRVARIRLRKKAWDAAEVSADPDQ